MAKFPRKSRFWECKSDNAGVDQKRDEASGTNTADAPLTEDDSNLYLQMRAAYLRELVHIICAGAFVAMMIGGMLLYASWASGLSNQKKDPMLVLYILRNDEVGVAFGFLATIAIALQAASVYMPPAREHIIQMARVDFLGGVALCVVPSALLVGGYSAIPHLYMLEKLDVAHLFAPVAAAGLIAVIAADAAAKRLPEVFANAQKADYADRRKERFLRADQTLRDGTEPSPWWCFWMQVFICATFPSLVAALIASVTSSADIGGMVRVIAISAFATVVIYILACAATVTLAQKEWVSLAAIFTVAAILVVVILLAGLSDGLIRIRNVRNSWPLIESLLHSLLAIALPAAFASWALMDGHLCKANGNDKRRSRFLLQIAQWWTKRAMNSAIASAQAKKEPGEPSGRADWFFTLTAYTSLFLPLSVVTVPVSWSMFRRIERARAEDQASKARVAKLKCRLKFATIGLAVGFALMIGSVLTIGWWGAVPAPAGGIMHMN